MRMHANHSRANIILCIRIAYMSTVPIVHMYMQFELICRDIYVQCIYVSTIARCLLCMYLCRDVSLVSRSCLYLPLSASETDSYSIWHTCKLETHHYCIMTFVCLCHRLRYGRRQRYWFIIYDMHSCQHGLIKLRESAWNEISRTHANFARVCTNASKMLLPEPHIHILALTL